MSADNDELQSRKYVDGFLASCALLLRFRRFLFSASICVAVIGAAFLFFRAVSLEPPVIAFILFALLSALVSLVFSFLPIKPFSLETEIDKRCDTGAVFSAYRTDEIHRSLLAPAVIHGAFKSAKIIRVFNAVSFRIAPIVSVAAFGCLLIVVAIALPDKQLFSAQQNFIRLIDELKAASMPKEVTSNGGQSEFTKNLDAALNDINKQWNEGEQAVALAKLNELLNAAKAAINKNASDNESKMKESGIPDEIAKMIASGFERGDAFSGSGVSSSSLNEAAKRIGGSLGASLAKAALAQVGTQEQANLLAQAADVARRLRAEEASKMAALSYLSGNYEQLLAGLTETEREKFLKIFTSSNTRPDTGLSSAMNTATQRPRNDGIEIVRLTVESPSYPVEFRQVIVKYSNKD